MKRNGITREDLEGSGFESARELEAWLAFCTWLDDPDGDPDAYVRLDSVTGWVPREQVQLTTRAASKLALLPTSAPRLLTLAEASAIVRTPKETIRYWIWQGRLVAFKPGRAVLVREDALLALAESRNSSKTRRIQPGPTRRKTAVVARKA